MVNHNGQRVQEMNYYCSAQKMDGSRAQSATENKYERYAASERRLPGCWCWSERAGDVNELHYN